MAMIRHSSKMDRPGGRKHKRDRLPAASERSSSLAVSFVTVEHIRHGVGETQPAGLQQVGGFDGRFGCRHATQTQHLEVKREKWQQIKLETFYRENSNTEPRGVKRREDRGGEKTRRGENRVEEEGEFRNRKEERWKGRNRKEEIGEEKGGIRKGKEERMKDEEKMGGSMKGGRGQERRKDERGNDKVEGGEAERRRENRWGEEKKKGRMRWKEERRKNIRKREDRQGEEERWGRKREDKRGERRDSEEIGEEKRGGRRCAVPAACALSGSLCWSWSVSVRRPRPICLHTESEERKQTADKWNAAEASGCGSLRTAPPPGQSQNARFVHFDWPSSDLPHWAEIGSSAHLHAGVPVLSEPVVGEVVRQAELGSDPLQVLRERRVAQQVDLTVGEPRLHPLLQQLQNILDGGEPSFKTKEWS